jgi:hypothetical protein
LSSPSSSTEQKARRYPGVASFADNDIHRMLFCGRQQEAYDLLHLVLAERHVVLFSRSGIGKSSIVNAGLMQPLREKGFFPMVVRAGNTDVDPLECFYAGVEAACKRGVQERQIDEFEPADPANWNRTSLWHFIKTFYIWREDKLLRPVLIFDQFEELFTLVDKGKRARFIGELADLVRGSRPRDAGHELSDQAPDAKFVFVIREEFLAEMQEIAERIPTILKSRFRLGPLDVEQAREAIVKPAALEGPQFATPPFTWSEDALKCTLDYLCKSRTAELATQAKSTVEPFQLQLVCQYVEDLVQKNGLTEVSAHELGGEAALDGILAHFYESTLTTLNHRFGGFRLKQRLRKLCEYGLITDRGRRLLREESTISRSNRVSPEILAGMVELRLIRKEPRVGDNYYELTHDTLIEPILKSRQRRERARWFALVPAAVVLVGGATAATLAMINEEARRFQASNDYLTLAYSKDYEWLESVSVAGELSAAEATEFLDGTRTIKGELTRSDKLDGKEALVVRWKLPVATSDPVEVMLPASGFVGELYVQTPGGETRHFENLGDGSVPRLCFAGDPGTAYIAVAGRDGETGPYEITGSRAPACSVRELDPSSIPLSGTLLSAKSNDGELVASEALGRFLVDRWDLAVTEAGYFSIALSSERFDTVLHVHLGDGRLLSNDDDDRGDGSATHSKLCFDTDVGTARILVSSLEEDETGLYSITAHATAACSPESLPVDKIESAGTLAVGAADDNVLEEGDRSGAFIVDRWDLPLAEFQSVTVALTSMAFDTSIHVHTPDGATFSNDDSGDGKNSSVCVSGGFEAGTAQVVVTSHSGVATGPYEISTESVPGCYVGDIAPEKMRISGALSIGEEVEDALGEGDRVGGFFVDRWDLEIAESATVSVKLASLDFDSHIRIYAPDGQIFSNDDFGDGVDSAVCFTADPGTLRIVASSYDGSATGSYRLSVESTRACAVEDLAPDDIRISGELMTGNAIDSALDEADRIGMLVVDRWILNLAENQLIAVSLSSSEFDAYLNVYTPEGLRRSDDDSGGGTDSSLCLSAGPGPVSVVVSSLSGIWTGPYRLAAEATTACTFDEFDDVQPEMITSSGQLIAGTAVDGSLGEGDELGTYYVDRWDMQLTESQSISLSLMPTGFQGYVDAYLPDGEMLLSEAFYGDADDVPFCFSAGPGTISFVISGDDYTATGNYRLIANATPGCTAGEIPPDAIPLSGELDIGSTMDGSLGEADRLGTVIVQRWELPLAEKQGIAISVSSLEFDTVLNAYLPDGTSLSNDDYGDGTNSSLCFVAGPGTAEVVVSSYYDSESGPYRMNISTVTACAQ